MLRQLDSGFLAEASYVPRRVQSAISGEASPARTQPELTRTIVVALSKGSLVRTAGLEPAQHYCRGILSPLCLPIPPCPHLIEIQSFLVPNVLNTAAMRNLCQSPTPIQSGIF